MSYLVCPDCGHDTFEQTRLAQTRVEFHVCADGSYLDIARDVDDEEDGDEATCTDCRASRDSSELWTLEAFEKDEETLSTDLSEYDG